MKHRINRRLGGFLVLSLVAWSALVFGEAPLFTFAQISSPCIAADPTHLASDRKHYAGSAEAFGKYAEKIGQKGVSFLLVDGITTAVGSTNDYKLMVQLASKAKTKVYIGKGDDRARAGNISDPTKLAPLADPEKCLPDYKPYGSFDLKDIHVVMIMQNVINPADNQTITNVMSFLNNDLEQAERKGAKGTILCINDGALNSWLMWWQEWGLKGLKGLDELVKKYKVNLVVCPGGPTQTQFPFTKVDDTCFVGGYSSLADTRFYPMLFLLYEVYLDRTVVKAVPFEDAQPPMEMVAYNPRSPGGKGYLDKYRNNPYGCETYAEDMEKKPLLTFIQISDTQLSPDSWKKYNRKVDVLCYEEMVKDINRLKPDFVINTGDLVNYLDPEAIAEYERVSKLIAVPLYETPGNHDRCLPAGKEWPAGMTDTQKLAEYYLKFAKTKTLNYTFKCKNVDFISVSSSDDLIEANDLRSSLETLKQAKYLFVWTHFPVAVYGGEIKNGNEIMPLFDQYKPTAFICGHRHRFGWRIVNGIPHITADGVGWGFTGMARADVVGGRSLVIYHLFPDKLIVGFMPMHNPIYSRIVMPVKPRSQ